MDKARLKEFVLIELQKSNEFMSSSINEPLVDKLIAEFCEKNPQDTEVFKVFTLSDEETDKIGKNIDAAIANGTIERIKYEQVVNHAGLACQSAVFHELMASFPDTEEELDLLEQELKNLKMEHL